jgi:type II secretory pathway pseudopilin PulG
MNHTSLKRQRRTRVECSNVQRRSRPARRTGMTILEVLFAIMITSVGLLGAIAVFPVASEYARKGRLNDEVTVCADAAVHKMDATGMRRPERWVAFVDNGVNPPNMVGGAVLTAAPAFPRTSFCIDPRFTAQNVGNNAGNPHWTYFPAFPRQVPVTANDPGSPRMQRITLVHGVPGGTAPYVPNIFPMGRFQADYVFSFEDQLAYERPGVQKGEVARADNAEPAFQLYSPIKINNGATILPGKREDEGKLSWLATLVPKIDRFSATLEDKYVLSIVVFYSRSPDLVIPDFTTNPPLKNEWTATILGSEFHSSGYGGGEVTITADNPIKLKMRAGDWLMLSGNAQANAFVDVNGVPTLSPRTVPIFKWYRVSDADEDPYEQLPIGSGIWKRDVSLVGPDWDMQDVSPYGANASPGGDGQPDDVEVTIVPGIVAVSDRTVRLELGGTGY